VSKINRAICLQRYEAEDDLRESAGLREAWDKYEAAAGAADSAAGHELYWKLFQDFNVLR
jgi:hypothetical protein